MQFSILPNMATKRKYKDSVFTSLFSDKKRLLELYNAIKGTSYKNPNLISINTLDGVLFPNRQNDISFTIGDKVVVLIEHQSSVNENMPLRALIYVGRTYEKIIDRRAIYRSTLLSIPTPEFYVLYNGAKDYPDEMTLKLSDAFRNAGIPDTGKLPSLDLIVRVLNINKGHNEKILEKCDVLRGYSAFIGQVRVKQQAGLELQDAIMSAIDFCVANGILAEYLESHSSEVRNMIFTEFNIEEAKEVWFEEGMEKGMEIGMNEMKKMVRGLLANDVPPETIARSSNLPLDFVKSMMK